MEGEDRRKSIEIEVREMMDIKGPFNFENLKVWKGVKVGSYSLPTEGYAPFKRIPYSLISLKGM